MSDTVISIEHVSKRYRLGMIGARTLKDEWAHAVERLRGRHARNQRDDEIWALRDVDFSVRRGEVLGIVGRNGAGKSTLLKILSRITAPTSGHVRLKGRVASLLEVGTGFHPELTGRDNIFLNGVILGMTKSEIRRRFDDIVAFAGVEPFIDTPVKRYSTGMYLRLAFAVAAHLDPEILVVDEVLAVGDIAFQKKCLGKMSDVVRDGRTILFVSHNMQAVRALCPRSLLLDQGQLVADGQTSWIAHEYHQRLRNMQVNTATDVDNERNRRGSGAVRFSSIAVLDGEDNETFNVRMGETVRFRLTYEAIERVPELLVSIALRSTTTGDMVTSVRHVISSHPCEPGQEGTIVVDLPSLAIRPGEYPLYFWLGDSATRPFDVVDNVTAPLMVSHGSESLFPEVDPSMPAGYVSIPSTVVHQLS